MSYALWRDRITLLVVLLLPWQGRIIKESAALNGYPWEQGTVSVFFVELLLLAALLCHVLSGNADCPPDRREPPVTFRLWALLLLYAGLSVFWSLDTLTGLFTWSRLFDGFALAYLIWISKLPIRRLMAVFLIGATIAAAVGLAQFLTQQAPGSTLFGMAEHDPAAAGTSVVETETDRLLRAYGPLPHPNVLGGYLAAALLAVLALAVDEDSQLRRRFLYALFGFITVAALATFSRSSWLAYAAALGAVVWGSALLRRPEARSRLRSALGVQLLCGAVFLAIVSPAFTARVTASGRLETRSFDERRIGFEQAKTLFLMHPAAGVGVGNMAPAAYDELLYLGHDFVYQPAHFLPALAAAELGFLGLALLLGAAVVWRYEARAAFRLAGRPLAQIVLMLPLVIAVVSIFDHYPATQFAGTMLAGLCFGLCFKTQDAVAA